MADERVWQSGARGYINFGSNSARVKEHCLFKDKSLYKKKEDYGRMIEQLTSYTVADKNKHDAVPDGMAMLSEYAQSFNRNKVQIFERYF